MLAVEARHQDSSSPWKLPERLTDDDARYMLTFCADEQESPFELQVHALEHGHVLIAYARSADAAAVRAMEGFAVLYSHEVLVASVDGLPIAVVLTAWGRIERLAAFDETAVDRFVRAFAGRYAHGWTR